MEVTLKADDRRPLYVHRKLKATGPLLAWARENGIENPLPAEELHVTVLYSKTPVDWLEMGEPYQATVEVAEGGPRMLQRFGEALVLSFASSDMKWRHESMIEAGASSDYPEYRPHVTLSYMDPDVDVEAIQPFTGKLTFGPEIFEAIEDDWKLSVLVGKGYDAPEIRSDTGLLPAPAIRLIKSIVSRDAACAALSRVGWHEDGEGGWRRTYPGGASPRASAALRASSARLALATVLAKGWKQQPRVPSGPKGGEWTAGGGLGLGGDMKPITAPHMGQGGLARTRFEEDPAQAAFMSPLTEAEVTGQPAFLENPYGYVLKNPSTPSDPRAVENPEDKATFTIDADPGAGLNGVPFEPWAGVEDWSKIGGTGSFDEPKVPNPGGKRLGAGVIIQEPDGRIWTVSPLNAFGGYVETFPKGGIEPGLNLRQTAIKEAFEESGLKIELTGFLGDFERTTSVARFYTARRVGGDPTGFHWETQATHLVPPDDMADSLTHHADAPILAALSGANESVIKALGVLADMLDLNMMIAKKAGGWQKQMRVPAGSPKGGEWTVYGSGGYGGALGFLGKDLDLQKYPGTGPQADKLNENIAAIQTAANTAGYLNSYALKLVGGPQPKQTYSAAAWQSAKEAEAYIAAKGANPGPVPALKAAAALGGKKFESENFSPNLSKQMENWKANPDQWAKIADLPGKGSNVAASKGALAGAAAKAAMETGKTHYMAYVGLVAAPAKHEGFKAGTAKSIEAAYQSEGGYRFEPDGSVFSAGVNGAGPKIGATDTPVVPKPDTGLKVSMEPEPGTLFGQDSNFGADFGTDPTFVQSAAQDIAALTDTTTPVVSAKPAKPDLPEMMQLTNMLQVGSKPGGSSAGAVFQDGNGQKWLVKSYSSELMARNEVAAAKVYGMLGVETPEMHLINIGGAFNGAQTNGIAVASKFMDTLQPFNPNSPTHLKAAQEDFGAHVLMANWDAVGLGFDNLMINPATGKAVMIDPGGSLRMRAMGAPKGEAFGKVATEYDTLRDPKMNPTSAKVFGSMTQSQINESVTAAATAWQLNMGPGAEAVIAQMGSGKDALDTIDKLDARSANLLAKVAPIEADLASTTNVDIADTGIVTLASTHSDPAVQAMMAYTPDILAESKTALIGSIADYTFEGKAANFYQKQITSLKELALKGDIEAVKTAKYQPASPSTIGSPNYQNYLQAHGAALQLAAVTAAQSTKATGGDVESGSLLTGAAKVTKVQLASAISQTGASPLDKLLSGETAATLKAMQTPEPKPASVAPAGPPPALPKMPVLSSPANKNYALVAKAESMKALADKAEPGAAAGIQAIALTITGTNSFNKKAKSYAADLIAALGGQATIDAMPVAAKATAMDAGLKTAAVDTIKGKHDTVKDFGSFKLVETSHIEHLTILDQMPKPQSYQNWQGSGTGVSSKPEINKANEAIEQAMYAAVQNADSDPAGALAALNAIDPGPSQWPKKYKAGLIAAIQGGQIDKQITTAQQLVSKDGGKVDPGAVAVALGEQVKLPQNYNALSNQKFYQHIKGAKIDPALARTLYDTMPAEQISTASATTKKLWEASNALTTKQKEALYGHVGHNATSGNGWASENNALRNGDKSSKYWAPAMEKAKIINTALTDVPVGTIVSRKITHGTFNEWKAMAGQVLNDPGINSTAVKNPTGGYPWGGTVQLRMKFAPGAKAAYVGPAAGKHGKIGAGSENELMLPRNTKWLIVGVGKDDMQGFSSNVIDVIVLPHDAPE